MSLQNLLKIGQLEEHETNAEQVRRMLDSAERGIADARQDSISPETRLDAAYRVITQLCMVADDYEVSQTVRAVEGYRSSCM